MSGFLYEFKKGTASPQTQKAEVSCVPVGVSVAFSILGVTTVFLTVSPKFLPTLRLSTNLSVFGCVSSCVYGLIGISEFPFVTRARDISQPHTRGAAFPLQLDLLLTLWLGYVSSYSY